MLRRRAGARLLRYAGHCRHVMNHADGIVRMLRDAGVRRLFGMPGGGSNADLIEAAGRAGMPFSLAHTEAASAFMAAAQAEVTGCPGACIATLGPGAASVMNGAANALLDRVPLLVITDCSDGAASAVMQHQALRQEEMFRPVVKWSGRLDVHNAADTLRRAIATALTPPAGPVHLDVSAAVTGAVTDVWAGADESAAVEPVVAIPDVLGRARRPVVLAGLGARSPRVAAALRGLCERRGVPALVTYKAKGVVPDRHAWFGGVFTNGALERALLERSDVVLAVGLDPVELLPRPWSWRPPVVAISGWRMEQRHIPVAAELIGDAARLCDAVACAMPGKSEWSASEVGGLAEVQRERMRVAVADGELAPHRVVELTAEVYAGARITVDAGAHMFPVMSLWPAEEPGGVLISNGLSTMGFALPAAIGAALLEPSRAVAAFTGDGGLMMCLGELRTAAREGLRLRIIVFDDGVLSLIQVKQVQRGYRTDGVTLGAVDWRAVASGMGVEARHADSEDGLRACLRETRDYPGPVLIAAKIAASAYQETIRALRGNS